MTREAAAPSAGPTLVVWPAVPAWRIDGELWLDRKFKDGQDEFAARWPGRIKAVMDVVDLPAMPAFGACRWTGAGEAWSLELIPRGEAFGRHHIAGADVLLASADSPRKLVAPDLCRGVGTACVMAIEYTLRTRLDMLRQAPMTPLKRLKTLAWHLRNEPRIRRALRECDGVQANGQAAFDAYTRGRPHGLLYWDTRLAAADVVGEAALEARLATLAAPRPLRLAFSGRLIAAKGADALVPLAAALQRRGVPVHFDVWGAGELEAGMRADIARLGLGSSMRVNGPVDFAGVLMPTLQRDVDLFVCCHRQGDPSCTYAETLGCGVPIAGFANESLSALVASHGVGWVVPMGAIERLADVVERLHGARGELADAARRARGFGVRNDFETVVAQRTAHCLAVAQAR
ncbi:MAG TPA: glycosyltransferase [Burkholderiaceae bacterium]